MGKPEEAIKWMKEALKIFESNDTELKKAKDEMLLIKLRYYAHLGNIYYVMGQYKEALANVSNSLTISTDEKNYSYDTAEDFKKHINDLSSMKLKCEAKIKGVSALDLKVTPEGEKVYDEK